MKSTLDVTGTDMEAMLADTVRCAPVLMALESGEFDCFMAAGTSVRIRDKKSGYFRFVINDGGDIPPLTEDVPDTLRHFIAVDEEYEDVWRSLFPSAKFTKYRLASVTRGTLNTAYSGKLPQGASIVRMDESWEELVIGLCEDEEFTADILRAQIREYLSLGLVINGARAGFISMHLTGELGPIWISPEYRCNKLGTILAYEYLQEHFKSYKLAFTLSAPENLASANVLKNLNFGIADRYILHATAGRFAAG